MTPNEIGLIAEKIALLHEIENSPCALKAMVRDVSQIKGLGYDIESFEFANGKLSLKAIEVKAWNKEGHFFLTENELRVLTSLGSNAWIYLVDINRKIVLRKIKDPFNSNSLRLAPSTYRVQF